jgi:hypothetical protein
LTSPRVLCCFKQLFSPAVSFCSPRCFTNWPATPAITTILSTLPPASVVRLLLVIGDDVRLRQVSFSRRGWGSNPRPRWRMVARVLFRLRRISRRRRIFSRRSPWRFLSYLLLPPFLPFHRGLAAPSVLVILVSHSASRHPPSTPIPAFRLSLSFSSLVVYPSSSSFRSVPSSSLSGSFHPFSSFVYLQLVVYPSLSLFRSVPSSSLPAFDSFVCCTSSDPQAFEQQG